MLVSHPAEKCFLCDVKKTCIFCSKLRKLLFCPQLLFLSDLISNSSIVDNRITYINQHHVLKTINKFCDVYFLKCAIIWLSADCSFEPCLERQLFCVRNNLFHNYSRRSTWTSYRTCVALLRWFLFYLGLLETFRSTVMRRLDLALFLVCRKSLCCQKEKKDEEWREKIRGRRRREDRRDGETAGNHAGEAAELRIRSSNVTWMQYLKAADVNTRLTSASFTHIFREPQNKLHLWILHFFFLFFLSTSKSQPRRRWKHKITLDDSSFYFLNSISSQNASQKWSTNFGWLYKLSQFFCQGFELIEKKEYLLN